MAKKRVRVQKIGKLDKATVRKFSQDFIHDVEHLERKYGIKIKYKGGNFSSTTFDMKIQVIIEDSEGRITLPEETNFHIYAGAYGFKNEDLGKIIRHQGKEFKIIGWLPNRRKNNVALQDLTTKRNCCGTPENVLALLTSSMSNKEE